MMLQKLFGVSKVHVYNPFEARASKTNYFLGYSRGLSKKKVNEIIWLVTHMNIDIVWLDHSVYGIIAKNLRMHFKTINIITFFHNIEYAYSKRALFGAKQVRYLLRYFVDYANEFQAVKYSDKIVVLNERDNKKLDKVYGRKSDIILPIGLNDEYDSKLPQTKQEEVGLLFVGSYFHENIIGLKWFVDNVMPHVNYRLTIIGKGMENLSLNKIYDIRTMGYVENLSEYYANADAVILPILGGSGMKVKTAEALMHGKHVIGTDEAFIGYSIHDVSIDRCNTAHEFIKAINAYGEMPKKFHSINRDLFLNEHSLEATTAKVKVLFKEFFN